MRKSLGSIVFSLVFTAAGAAFSADSLFSQVAVDSVFSEGNSTPARQPQADAEQGSLHGLGAVTETLRKAGFETKEVGSQVVSIKAKTDKLSLPVLVSLSDDQRELSFVVLLGEMQDDSQLPSSKLLGLLSANRQHAPAFFSYSPKRKRMELHRVLENRAATSERLRQEIDRLAGVATQTRSLWDFASSGTGPSGKAASSLVGKWSAVRSDREAFALRLGADGTFMLVHVNDGTQSNSSGKFIITGTSLKFVASDKTVLSGTLSRKSNDEFHFLPQNAGSTAALAFKRS